MSNDVILQTRNLTKQFPGVLANDHVNLSVRKGEIHAIMGENGAGKSTLCNMLTGLYTPTSGEIEFDGNNVKFGHPRDALAAGIRMVYQERNLIDYLTGAQSICLGLEARKHKVFVDNKRIIERSREICNEIGADIPLDIPVKQLSPAQQQMIEIIRAVAHDPKLLILDEPTASLGNAEVKVLFNVMRKLKQKGVAVILITHKLEEVFEISDVISIMRNGTLVDTVKNGSVNRFEIVGMMLGKDVSGHYPAIEDESRQEVMLEMKGISDTSGKIKDISLNVKKGEVVGLYGLLGSGRTELLETIFGLRKAASGDIVFNGETISAKKTTRQMINKGVALVPEDRRHLSIFRESFTILENMTIGYFDKISNRIGLINRKAEKKLFRDLTSRQELRVKYAREDQNISQLSGGNQQKIVLGRWIFRENLQLLLLDEPTHGIDVGVKYDIYVLIRKMAAEGKSVLIVSSELPELTGICDRMYIIKDGRLIDDIKREEFDNERILEMVL